MNLLKHFDKKDIFSFLSLIVIFLVFLVVFWKYQGSIIMDCPNEAYIPQEILKGKILYKDFYYGYGPFTYLFNTLLFIIFTQNMLVLYLAGAITSLIILSSLYLITRNFSSPFESFVICLLIISLCMFNNHFRNVSYIFPYTYSILYALCFFILSVLFCIYYFKNDKAIYAIISILFASLSLTSKYEFFFYCLFLFIVILLIKPIEKKHYINCLIALFSLPLISIAILFIQGLTLNDLLVNFQIVYNFSHTPSLHHFYKLRGTLPSWEFFSKTLINFGTFSVFFVISFSMLYFILNKIHRLKSLFFKYTLTSVVVLVCIAICVLSLLDDPLKYYVFFQANASWLPLSSVLIFIYFCIYSVIKKKKSSTTTEKQNFNFKNIISSLINKTEKKQLIYLFLVICAILASIKTFSYSTFNHIGGYLTLLNIIVAVIFLTQYLPLISNRINISAWKVTTYILLILFSVNCAAINYCLNLTTPIESISTSRGTMYGNKSIVKPLQNVLDYVNENLNENDSLLFIPRCTSLNFLTNRSTNTKHINVDLIIMDTIGEKNIIEDFKKNPADYIVITNEDLNYFYKPLQFGVHYGLNLSDYIKENYKLVKFYDSGFKLFLFKKNTLIKEGEKTF